MAKIIIDETAARRIGLVLRCITDHDKATLIDCISRLGLWSEDSTVYIYNDFDEMSFFFSEVYESGRQGLCGGIIYHGARDGYGSGQGPTFSACLEPTSGYSIHT